MEKKRWWESKTVWTGITSIVGAVAGVLTGALTAATAAPIVVPALIGIFLRDAINKG